jgi:low affinity Fe/Cu permease
MPEHRNGATPREHTIFAVFARWTERQMGRPATFLVAVLVVVVWGVSGPIFAWSDTWQLVINTGTTIVTFLMVFVIQHTQTRDTQALQLKLDELIRVSETARNSLISLEERPDSEVDDVRSELAELTAKADPSCPATAPALGPNS